MQPKQALDLFRSLAANHVSAFTDLCDSFDARNANGSNMSHNESHNQAHLRPPRHHLAALGSRWLAAHGLGNPHLIRRHGTRRLAHRHGTATLNFFVKMIFVVYLKRTYVHK